MKTLQEDAEQTLVDLRDSATADSSPTLTNIYEKVAKVGLKDLSLKEIEILRENSDALNRRFVEEHKKEIDSEWGLKLYQEYPTMFPEPTTSGCSLV